MKGIEIFCASQASTAICLTTDHASSSSSSSSNTVQFGGRAIDRHNPIITDPKRTPARDFITSPNYDPVLGLNKVDDNKKKAQVLHEDEKNHSSKQQDSSSSVSKSDSSNQVVVLRVSLHCKGCEGKVRKHLSRMQGVTSFNIDFAAKKVTVVGDVTPLSVMASISKVKTAQIWPESATPIGSTGAAESKK
ncbi:hypothetical protein TSUD_337410 [Trifolium subterraneum]|uniref:HMA domain-containing protein n=1 Tax=Trifolium subterraneum TaxID=3900 RepID=A0A2Z6NUZ5_TRISU|nr:hypothetical protein TSUD_337410 [Trifolium subterraneum]